MNNPTPRRNRKWKFSLRHLLTLTALAALFIAVSIAYRNNDALNQSRATLRSLSSRLEFVAEDELAFVALPKVASNFETWEIHVPRGPEFELRFGIGEVSKYGIPSRCDRVRISAGRHRVTLNSVVPRDTENRFVVYVDGKQEIVVTPGADWMASGWNSSSGMSWTAPPTTGEQSPRQLAGQIYTPQFDVGKHGFFNGTNDPLVSGPGYRLWIDQPDRTYSPATPFCGFQPGARFNGIGLRDGLRFRMTTIAPGELRFIRPKSRVRGPVLRIVPEFIVDGQTVVPSKKSASLAWQLHEGPNAKEPFGWTEDPQRTVYNAFVHAEFDSVQDVEPVIELQWDAARPNEVGLRLAKAPANERITGLRLRVIGGAEHLWRTINAGGKTLDSRDKSGKQSPDLSDTTMLLDPTGDGLGASDEDETVRLGWQTDHSMPLQVVQRNRGKPGPYDGLTVYQGLPLKFGACVPITLDPSISVTQVNQHPTIAGTAFPGGAVFDEVQIKVKASQDDWIWLEAQDLNATLLSKPTSSSKPVDSSKPTQ